MQGLPVQFGELEVGVGAAVLGQLSGLGEQFPLRQGHQQNRVAALQGRGQPHHGTAPHLTSHPEAAEARRLIDCVGMGLGRLQAGSQGRQGGHAQLAQGGHHHRAVAVPAELTHAPHRRGGQHRPPGRDQRQLGARGDPVARQQLGQAAEGQGRAHGPAPGCRQGEGHAHLAVEGEAVHGGDHRPGGPLGQAHPGTLAQHEARRQ